MYSIFMLYIIYSCIIFTILKRMILSYPGKKNTSALLMMSIAHPQSKKTAALLKHFNTAPLFWEQIVKEEYQ